MLVRLAARNQVAHAGSLASARAFPALDGTGEPNADSRHLKYPDSRRARPSPEGQRCFEASLQRLLIDRLDTILKTLGIKYQVVTDAPPAVCVESTVRGRHVPATTRAPWWKTAVAEPVGAELPRSTAMRHRA